MYTVCAFITLIGPTYIDMELVYDPANDDNYGFYHGVGEEETDSKLELMDELNRDPSYNPVPGVNEDFESMQYYDSMLVNSHSIAESELSTLPEGGVTKAAIPSDLSIATTSSMQIEEVSIGTTTSSVKTVSASSPWEEMSGDLESSMTPMGTLLPLLLMAPAIIILCVCVCVVDGYTVLVLSGCYLLKL